MTDGEHSGRSILLPVCLFRETTHFSKYLISTALYLIHNARACALACSVLAIISLLVFTPPSRIRRPSSRAVSSSLMLQNALRAAQSDSSGKLTFRDEFTKGLLRYVKSWRRLLLMRGKWYSFHIISGVSIKTFLCAFWSFLAFAHIFWNGNTS